VSRRNFRLYIFFLVFVSLLVVGCSSSGNQARYVLTPKGDKRLAKRGEFGLPEKDIDFLSVFRGRLINHIPKGSEELRELIKKTVLSNFKKKKAILSRAMHFDSEREELAAYLMLRTNGSMPIYKVTKSAPNDLSLLIEGAKGNCTHYSLRLLMLLDIFGFRGRAVTLITPSLPGHVVVGAYDPIERKAYLLDANLNVFSKFDNVDEGFFDVALDMTTEQRERYFEDPHHIKFFPLYISGVENMRMSLKELQEKLYDSVEDKWLDTLIRELPMAVDGWKKRYPGAIPLTLDEYRTLGGLTVLNRIGIEYPLSTASLLRRAGKVPLGEYNGQPSR
jgi:hypothetical protein